MTEFSDTPTATKCVLLAITLQAVRTAKGSKGKQEVLAAALADDSISDVLRNVLKYAYDGTIRFGISPGSVAQPVTKPTKPRDFDLWVFTRLDAVILESSLTAKRMLVENALASMSEEGRDLLMNILAKDLRAGFSESTINKAAPGLLSKFDVMLAQPFLARRVKKWPVAIEPKLDGLRVIAEVNTANKSPAAAVNFYTRSGKDITSLSLFKEEVYKLAQAFAEGFADARKPVVAFDAEVTSGSFLESLSAVRSGSKQVEEGTVHIFDVLHRMGTSPIGLDDDELAKQGMQSERRQLLINAMQHYKKYVGKPEFTLIVDSYMASSEDEVMAYYARSRDQGLEGIIVKDIDAPYVKKRSPSWMKIKGEETLDLPIVGAFEGTGKYVGQLGGLIVLNGEVEVRVGGGFSDAQRVEYWGQIQADLAHIDRDERDRCVLIDCLAEVQFQEQMPSGSLRHPVFVRLRRDKTQGSAGRF